MKAKKEFGDSSQVHWRLPDEKCFLQKLSKKPLSKQDAKTRSNTVPLLSPRQIKDIRRSSAEFGSRELLSLRTRWRGKEKRLPQPRPGNTSPRQVGLEAAPRGPRGSRPAEPRRGRPLTVPGLGLGARRLLLPAARRAPHPPARRPPAQRAGHAAGGTAIPAGERGGGGGRGTRCPAAAAGGSSAVPADPPPPGPVSISAGGQRPARAAPPRAPRPLSGHRELPRVPRPAALPGRVRAPPAPGSYRREREHRRRR